MRESKRNILKEPYVFLITFLYKFRVYGMEHRAGLEADSEFEKNVAVAKAGIYSQPSLPAKHLNKSISWHDRTEDIWHPFFFAILANTTRKGVQFHPEPNTDYRALNTT